MRVRTGVEVQAQGVYRRVIDVGKGLEAIGDDGQHATILVIGEAIEELVSIVDLPVEASQAFNFAKG